MPTSSHGIFTAFRTATSTSRRDFRTASSMRAGWIRPSLMRRTNATSGNFSTDGVETGIATVSGVSSTSRSTPVFGFDRRMVSALAPDQPTFDIFRRYRNTGHRCFADYIRSQALQRRRQDFACSVVGLVLVSELGFAEATLELVGVLVFRSLEQEVP